MATVRSALVSEAYAAELTQTLYSWHQSGFTDEPTGQKGGQGNRSSGSYGMGHPVDFLEPSPAEVTFWVDIHLEHKYQVRSKTTVSFLITLW